VREEKKKKSQLVKKSLENFGCLEDTKADY